MEKINPIYKSILILTLIFSLFVSFQYLQLRYNLCYSFSPDMRGQEKNVVYGIQQTMTGLQNLYKSIDKPPFAFIQYTPIYYWLCANICNSLELKPGQNLIEIYRTSRLVNLGLNLLSCLLLFYILNNLLGVHWMLTLLACNIFLISTQSHTWSIRPDALKNVIFLGSVLLFLLWRKTELKLFGVLSALAVGLAIFTKQDMVALPIAFLIFLVIYSEKKEWFTYFGWLSIVAIILISLFTLIYGFSIWQNLYWAVNNGSSLANAKGIIVGYFGTYIYFIPLGVFTTFYWLSHKSLVQEKFLAILTLVLFVFGCLATSKSGSLIAYFNETNTAILLSITFFISSYIKQNETIVLFASCLSFGIIFQEMSAYKPEMDRLKGGEIENSEESHYKDVKSLETYFRQIKNKNKVIYSNDPFVKNMLFAHVILPMDDIVFFNMKAGTFDPKPYQDFYQSRKIDFAIFKDSEPHQDILGQQFDNFIPIKTVGRFTLYKKN